MKKKGGLILLLAGIASSLILSGCPSSGASESDVKAIQADMKTQTPANLPKDASGAGDAVMNGGAGTMIKKGSQR